MMRVCLTDIFPACRSSGRFLLLVAQHVDYRPDFDGSVVENAYRVSTSITTGFKLATPRVANSSMEHVPAKKGETFCRWVTGSSRSWRDAGYFHSPCIVKAAQ